MHVTFDFSNRRISIEGDAPELVQVLTLAREIAPNLPAINIITEPQKNGNGVPRLGNDHGSESTQTLRQFVRSLSLSNAAERIAAISYYQNKVAKVPSVSPKEMGDLFTQCGFQKPKQMPVALFDSRRKYGYMESAGHGAWRISTNGENLIVGKLEERGTEE